MLPTKTALTSFSQTEMPLTEPPAAEALSADLPASAPLATAAISTEIWLRLLAVSSLPGDVFLSAARRLQHLLSPVDQQENTAKHNENNEKHGNISNSDNKSLRKLSQAEQQQALRHAGLNSRQIQKFMAVSEKSLEQSLRWLEQPDHQLICADDPRYPPLLRVIDWYPGAIFVAGNPQALLHPQLAVVGSRALSWYGEHWCQQFVQRLAGHFTITSGLAAGIDSVAHAAALAAHSCTVAVLGNGLLDIYPKKHQRLAKQIIEQGGALVSEFPLDTTPWPGNFPRRNRIISGLSLGVLVVEASLRSGSLVTARYALEQGREVFALPGPLGNPGCEGTHWLIKQGASITTCPEDIYQQLPATCTEKRFDGQPFSLQNGVQTEPAADETQATTEQQKAAQTLPFAALLANVGDEVTAVDDIALRSQQPLAQVSAQLLELELAGLVAAVPGGYVRLRKLAK